MNALQLLITGNSYFHPENSQKKSWNDTSKHIYNLFIHILSYIQPQDIQNARFVSKIWNKATIETVSIQHLLRNRLQTEALVDTKLECENPETLSEESESEDSYDMTLLMAERIDESQQDLTLENLSRSQIAMGEYQKAREIANNIQTENLRGLAFSSVNFALGEKAIVLAEAGQFVEAMEFANSINDTEIRLCVIQAIDDCRSENTEV